MTPLDAHRFFRHTFDLRFTEYMDAELFVTLRKPVLDVFKFDDWLHEQHGNYEKEGLSMQTLLIKHYGQDVADKIQQLL